MSKPYPFLFAIIPKYTALRTNRFLVEIPARDPKAHSLIRQVEASGDLCKTMEARASGFDAENRIRAPKAYLHTSRGSERR